MLQFLSPLCPSNLCPSPLNFKPSCALPESSHTLHGSNNICLKHKLICCTIYLDKSKVDTLFRKSAELY
uniref:Uncharacterized protein n=1 Tax=Anguilla anguilla TaxID=7936 RepID=A0A0E9SBT5_ANGAN